MAAAKSKTILKYHGRAEELFGIHVVNLFLSLITLGIYSFWGRVRIRKYIWGQFEFNKARFSYHGTGPETLKGWLKAALIFGVPYILLTHGPRWAGLSVSLIAVGALLSIGLFILFIPMAVVGSRRYRLSRSAWRGIRFSFRKTWRDYLPMALKGNILILVTLGIYAPFYDMSREKFLIANSWIGDRRFGFDGKGDDLLGFYLVSLLLAIPTLGLSLFWYHVYKKRYIWDHTTLGGARVHCTITFGGMLGLDLGNLLLTLVTLGLAYPWAQTRTFRYMCANLRLKGNLRLGGIKQKARIANATGEELASLLDLDLDLG